MDAGDACVPQHYIEPRRMDDGRGYYTDAAGQDVPALGYPITRSGSRKRLSPEGIAERASLLKPPRADMTPAGTMTDVLQTLSNSSVAARLFGGWPMDGSVSHNASLLSHGFPNAAAPSSDAEFIAMHGKPGDASSRALLHYDQVAPQPSGHDLDAAPHEVPLFSPEKLDVTIATGASFFHPARNTPLDNADTQRGWDADAQPPYSALLSGPGFHYGRDGQDPFFGSDAISMGSMGSDTLDDDDGGSAFMIDSGEGGNSWDDGWDEAPDGLAAVHSFSKSVETAASGSGKRTTCRDGDGGGDAAAAVAFAADNGAAAAADAAVLVVPTLDDPGLQAAGINSPPDPWVAAAAEDGGTAAAAAAVHLPENLPQQQGQQQGVEAAMCYGLVPPVATVAPDRVPPTDDEELVALKDAGDEGGVVPDRLVRSISSESVGSAEVAPASTDLNPSGAASGDENCGVGSPGGQQGPVSAVATQAGGGGSFHASTATAAGVAGGAVAAGIASADASLASGLSASRSDPGTTGTDDANGFSSDSTSAHPPTALAAVGAAAAAAAGGDSDGTVAAAAAAPPPHQPLPSLLSPEVYLGVVSQLVESVRRAARGTATASITQDPTATAAGGGMVGGGVVGAGGGGPLLCPQGLVGSGTAGIEGWAAGGVPLPPPLQLPLQQPLQHWHYPNPAGAAAAAMVGCTGLEFGRGVGTAAAVAAAATITTAAAAMVRSLPRPAAVIETGEQHVMGAVAALWGHGPGTSKLAPWVTGGGSGGGSGGAQAGGGAAMAGWEREGYLGALGTSHEGGRLASG